MQSQRAESRKQKTERLPCGNRKSAKNLLKQLQSLQKHLKNLIIVNIYPIASKNNLNFQNTKLTNIHPIITIIAIDISEKLIITSISIAKIKTISNPLIVKTLIVSSIKITTKLKKPIKIYNYLDNSLVDK